MIDGKFNGLNELVLELSVFQDVNFEIEIIVDGDALCPSIAAASILAKEHRDRLMNNMHKKYPEYGFDKHKGYGTKIHIERLNLFGHCDIHRKSFRPIKNILENKNLF